jgi:hypothetical protein
MQNRKYFLWGFFVPLSILAITSILTAIKIAIAYDGKCGGFLPWLAGPQPCSFWKYFSGNSSMILTIVWISYWPFILAFIFVPAFIGFFLDRKANRDPQNFE